MVKGQINIQFCGFGGQGIILLAVAFGTTVVTKVGLNAVQTQSYGSEARGGECQAEVIVSDEIIDSPLADKMDILVSMSQPALEKYLPRLKPAGMLVYDPEFVEVIGRRDIRKFEAPATRIAGELGVKLAANMVMLGYIHQAIGLSKEADLFEVVRDNVPARFVDVNVEAARRGIVLAKQHDARFEI
jgi:2-oxoglutarate ferredoxin oxidoreductase subunit gamma